MRAMILAAGYGRRLAPLTNTIPKALVSIGGRPLLEIVLRRLETEGFTEIAVNLHHLADQVREFLETYRRTTKASIYLSYEPELLDTGGGIKKMLDYLPGDDPILVHNVDVLSDCPLDQVMEHFKSLPSCDALLVALDQLTDRPLCFDQNMNFRGRGDHLPTEACRHYAFTGIQVIRPDLFRIYPEKKFYSIDLYLWAAALGRTIKGLLFPGTWWRDLGTLSDLAAAERDLPII
ncbi:MAG: nucleotidyltransferase family protein [candidate division KSB1 bacterium]|nr:nucleotidyltransferase family protein [candidate division KSB1 bacterium]